MHLYGIHCELVQLKLNIEVSDGDSTPPEVYEEPPLKRSEGLENWIDFPKEVIL